MIAPATSQARINELAQTVVERLRAGDTRGALDRLHGQRGGNEDHEFERRFTAAFSVKAGRSSAALLAKLSEGERALFDAYLRNPSGMSRPEDIAFIAMQGAGTSHRAINDLYDDLRNRHPDPADYRRAVAEMDRRFIDRYGAARGNPTSLEADLTDGVWSELGGDDRQRYRAARAQAPDALELWLAGEGRMGTSSERVLDRLAANVHRLDRLAAEYGYVADGVEGQGVRRLQSMITHELSGHDAARANALIAGGHSPEQRAGRYLELTLEGYLAGRVSRDDAIRAIRTVANTDDGVLAHGAGAQFVSESIRRRVLEGARDREVSAAVGELSWGSAVDGGAAIVAELDRRLAEGGGRSAQRELGRFLDNLTDDQRNAILAAHPDLERRIDMRFADPAARARLLGAARGELDAVDLLHYAGRELASGGDVLQRVNALGIRDRADFASIYESRYGRGSFERAVAELGSEERRALRLALAAPRGVERHQLDDMLGQVRDVMSRERGSAGWTGFSSWFTDRFGFSGPIVDDASREVAAAARAAAAANEAGHLGREHVVRLVNAQRRLEQAMRTYGQDRADIAQSAADAAIIAVSVATLGSGITVAALSRAALAAGVSNTTVNGAVTGPNYTASQATYDFFSAAGLEIGGGVAFVGARAGARSAWRALRRGK